jgi:hypothetical protein
MSTKSVYRPSGQFSPDKRRSIELSCLHRQPTGSCSSVHRIDVAGFPRIWWLIDSVPKRSWVAA